MSIAKLQERIRRKKTPLALYLSPEIERIAPQVREQFTALYGDSPMAAAESLRYHGCQMLDAAAELLPAVILDAAAYLRCGAAGMDVLANLVSAARSRELYSIVDARGALAEPWLAALPGADAVTVLPYLGSDACTAPAEQAVFAVVSTANPSAGDIQQLRAGDRPLCVAAAEQMARHGAGILLESSYSLDIRDMRRRLGKAFFLLTNCTAENGSYAFDDYGHGALAADRAVQYAPHAPAAIAQAVAEWKKWVTVV